MAAHGVGHIAAQPLLLNDLHAQVKSPFPWLPTNFDTTVNGNYRGARITSRAGRAAWSMELYAVNLQVG